MAQIQVRDSNGAPVPSVRVRFSEGTKSSDEAIYDNLTDLSGNSGWPIPFWPDADYTIHVNTQDVNARFGSASQLVPKGYGGDVGIVLPFYAVPQPEPGAYPFPGETGRLRVEGQTFRREDGSLFQWRGFTWFLGFLRFCRGEDITPDLVWMRSLGVNIPRIFGPLPWAETPDYRVEHFDFWKLNDFLVLLKAYGLRSNWSLCHYPGPDWNTFLRRFYEIAANHPGVVVEAVNEPHVGEKPDPIAILKGVDRRGVLTAYGLYGKYYDSAPDLDPVLDFATIHVQRDSAWHRKARHAQEWQNSINKPVISDEPAKMTEPGFVYSGGKNDPNTTPAEMVWHGTVCSLWTPGFTLHTEEGKWGRVPQPGMLQHTVCEAVKSDVWTRIDASWQTGQYKGAHSSGSPVDGDGLKINGQDIWTYSSVHPNRSLSVRCAFSAPQPINGWREVNRWGAAGSIVQLER